jgi:hypothetical protein
MAVFSVRKTTAAIYVPGKNPAIYPDFSACLVRLTEGCTAVVRLPAR